MVSGAEWDKRIGYGLLVGPSRANEAETAVFTLPQKAVIVLFTVTGYK